VGQVHQFEVSTRWASAGRVNLMGSLYCFGDLQMLEYRLLDGKCDSEALQGYLDTLAEGSCLACPTVVVLDNAGAHRAKRIGERLERWAAKGLRLYYLPPYCPHLNLVECWWKKLKSFLMPRRCYDSLAQLKQALMVALNALCAIAL
jgi:putative transposase